MGVLVANFDESGKQRDHKVVALAAICAEDDTLQTFNAEWRKLLRYFEIDALHLKKFMQVSACLSPKIPKAKGLEDRAKLLKPFADCINDFLEFGILQAWDVAGFHSIPKSFRYQMGSVDDPYLLAFAYGLMRITEHSKEEQKVSIICDHDQEIALDCLKHFNGMRHADKKYSSKLISMTFADDRFFPSLQAADMAAYFVRLEAMRLFHAGNFRLKWILDDLCVERGPGKMKWEILFATKEKLAESVWTLPERLKNAKQKH